jgi:hypothetical protein
MAHPQLVLYYRTQFGYTKIIKHDGPTVTQLLTTIPQQRGHLTRALKEIVLDLLLVDLRDTPIWERNTDGELWQAVSLQNRRGDAGESGLNFLPVHGDSRLTDGFQLRQQFFGEVMVFGVRFSRGAEKIYCSR